MSYKKTVAYIAQGLLDLFRNIQNILFAAGIFTHNPQGMAVNPMKNSTNDKINQKKVKQKNSIISLINTSAYMFMRRPEWPVVLLT